MVVKKIKAEDTWNIRHKVMWPDKPFEFVRINDDHCGTHYGLFDRDELVSVVSCFENGKEMQFRKLATLTNKQKHGFASHLLAFIIDKARQKGLKRIWCNARLNKKYFYEKFGLVDTNQKFFKEDKEYTIMELKLD